MLDFYTLQETLKMVAELSNDKYTYTAKDIATLCRADKLTPFFSYNHYVAEKIEILHGNTGEYYEDFSPYTITSFKGYLTNHQLLDLLDGYRDSILLEYAHNDKGHELQLVANNVVLDRLESENYSPYSSDDAIKVTKEQLFFKREQVQKYIEELSEQLSQQTDKLADSVTHSNTDIQNVKKAAIKQFNISLAKALIKLDYQDKLRKRDIVDFIIPYMEELTFILADKDEKKADNLTVSYDTLYDTHLQGMDFKVGRQSNEEKNKVNIELLFKKQLPVTE